jgi:hypothetical protein
MSADDHVLLVHGLWLNGAVMTLMRRRIAQRGYAAEAYTYPSMRLGLTENAERLARYCSKLGAGRLHLVGHSMGGVVILNAIQRLDLPCLGRVVVVGTPYAECFTARRLQRLPVARRLLGQCMPQCLTARCDETFARFEIGVIAGCGGVGGGRLIAPDLPRPNDGVVCVSETAVPGMRDQIVLDVSHTAMLLSQEVVRQVCTFIERGAFSHEHATAA